MFARVAVNLPAVGGEFDYHTPPDLADRLRPGSLVTVPFGRQIVQAVVLDLVEHPSIPETRPIASLLDPQPVLTLPQIHLARWLSQHYLQPLSAMVGLMIPPGLNQQVDTLYTLTRSTIPDDSLPPLEKRLIRLLQDRGGTLRGRQIDRHCPRLDWRRAADRLVRRGLLHRQSMLLPARSRPRFVRMAGLTVSPDQAMAALPTLGKGQALARRQAALRFLLQATQPVNVSWIYADTGCTLDDLRFLEARRLIRVFDAEIFRDPLQRIEPDQPPPDLPLTPDQESALQAILTTLEDTHNRPIHFLLHGVTGSGKTELYLRATQATLRQGRQVIILVPEIALTPQMVQRFLARFPGQVGVMHSQLSEGERFDTWRRARQGDIQVIIGPRSALFAPFPNIGLIVADECHDSSYYQSEPPYYHAITAAREYARLCGAVFVMGSATPTIEQRFQAIQAASGIPPTDRVHLLSLPQRVTDWQLPSVTVVDMRAELRAGNRSIFSRPLIEALAEALLRQEQAILFLNRRGSASYVFCRTCGTPLKCPRCDIPLTYHIQLPNLPTPSLLCHRCGYRRQMPKHCPTCNSDQIRHYGLGTEKVESEIRALFPQARTLRWDWETTRRKDAHHLILTHFANHQADILIGTQMLAKGLDLPLVTVVGIVLADVGLNLPDPFASERAFQILTQVAGRAGRSSRGGQVILQTFTPDHYVIQAAARHDVEGFYRYELEQRRQLGYPPFGRLVRLEYRHYDAARAEAEAQRVQRLLQDRAIAEGRSQTTILAVPCFFAKVDNLYRWQVILRGPDPLSLLHHLPPLPDWRIETEPISLL